MKTFSFKDIKKQISNRKLEYFFNFMLLPIHRSSSFIIEHYFHSKWKYKLYAVRVLWCKGDNPERIVGEHWDWLYRCGVKQHCLGQLVKGDCNLHVFHHLAYYHIKPQQLNHRKLKGWGVEMLINLLIIMKALCGLMWKHFLPFCI